MRVPRVVWVGLSGDINALLSVQDRIEEALAKLNFTPENRPFSASSNVRQGQRKGLLLKKGAD